MQADLFGHRSLRRAMVAAAILLGLGMSTGYADTGKASVPDTKIYSSECVWDVPLSTRAMGYITPGDYVIVFSTLQPVAVVQSARVIALSSTGAKLALPRKQAKALIALKPAPAAHFEVRGTGAPGKPMGKPVRFKADGVTRVVNVDKDGNKLPDIHCIAPSN